MTDQQTLNYQRVAQAIDYICLHFKEQPSLDDLASVVGLSSYHFQRLFVEWAGVSPKQFVQYLSVNYAKQLIKNEQLSLLDTAHLSGLSGTGRLHDLFIKIEAMTPGEFKNGGQQLAINYSFLSSPFGGVFVASTEKGVCQLSFEADKQLAIAKLANQFPNAQFNNRVDDFHQQALTVFQTNWHQIDQLRLHLRATPFQLKVWQALLSIPLGGLTTYGSLATQINNPKASRAVGSAIGKNPVAFLIPCHRVIQNTGKLGGYRWGETRKSAIIAWELSKRALRD